MKYIIRNLVKDEYIKYRDIVTKIIQENLNKKLNNNNYNLEFRDNLNELSTKLKELDTRYQKIIIYYLGPEVINNNDKQKEIYLEHRNAIDTKYNKFKLVIDRIISLKANIWQLVALDEISTKRK